MWSNQSSVAIHGGFPNPAADRSLNGLDLHKLLIKNPSSTFFMRIEGNDWEERGIFGGDTVVIDRVLSPRLTDLVILTKDASFLLVPFSKLPADATCWGVVTSVVHQYRK